MKYRVDRGDPNSGVAVGLCSCGNRFLAFDQIGCMRRLADHEKVHHPGDKDARAGLAQALRRAADPQEK